MFKLVNYMNFNWLIFTFCPSRNTWIKVAWFSSLKFRSADPVEVFIASPSPVVFTGYEVGQVYEVCIKLMWQNFHMVTSDSEQITPHTLSVMSGYKFVPFSLSFIATGIR